MAPSTIYRALHRLGWKREGSCNIVLTDKVGGRERTIKTIGVLGGMGPQATMDFETRVHTISQRLIPQFANSGYTPMVVYYHCAFPFVLDERHKPVLPLQPEPHLVAKLAKLGEMVDFIVMTSNAPHMFRDLIEQTSGRKVLSMIDVTLEEVRARGWQRVSTISNSRSRLASAGLRTGTRLPCEASHAPASP